MTFMALVHQVNSYMHLGSVSLGVNGFPAENIFSCKSFREIVFFFWVFGCLPANGLENIF